MDLNINADDNCSCDHGNEDGQLEEIELKQRRSITDLNKLSNQASLEVNVDYKSTFAVDE
jgi:hypothetical protein